MSSQIPNSIIPSALQVEYPMVHNERQVVNVQGQTVHNALEVERTYGLPVPLLAKINAGRQLFSVLDTRATDEYSSPLLVVSDTFYHGSEGSFKGVWQDEDPLMFGRNPHYKYRFDYHPTVSSEHFSLAFDGLGLIVANQRPKNKTLLTGDLQGKRFQRDRVTGVEANFTQRTGDKMRDRFDFGYEDETAPYGYYKNHRIIGRKTSIVKDSVYFTATSEAVVVDDKSRALQHVADGLLQHLDRKFGKYPTVPVESFLKIINNYVRKVMPYDEAAADRLSRPHYANNSLIGLSEYVKEGVGVCRHQCLVAAFLLETLIEKRILAGRTGVERNHDTNVHGAHAWAVYESPARQLFVIDPAQNFVGTKEKAHEEGRWKYDLPAER